MNALLSLLNLNDPITAASPAAGKASTGLKLPNSSGPPVWKILVLDQQTKDVLATVLRVQDLRDIGVTLHVYVYVNESVVYMIEWTQAAPCLTPRLARRAGRVLRVTNPRQYPTYSI